MKSFFFYPHSKSFQEETFHDETFWRRNTIFSLVTKTSLNEVREQFFNYKKLRFNCWRYFFIILILRHERFISKVEFFCETILPEMVDAVH